MDSYTPPLLFVNRFFLFFFGLLFAFPAFSQPIIYVTPAGAGNNSGASWANALLGTQLPSRIATATAGTQFWVAAGTYKPTTTTDRAASFSIASGVSVYGGFAGTETALNQRVSGQNETVLSGDIGVEDYAQDNSQIIIRLENVGQKISIDGLTIRDGRIIANDIESTGSGIKVDVTNIELVLSISNCRFVYNVIEPSFTGGGAIGILARNNGQCNLTLKNCYLSGNEAGWGGAITPQTLGGIITSVIEDCVFSNNRGLNNAGAISYAYVNQPELTSLQIRRCSFSSNKAFYAGGAIVLGDNKCAIENCLFTNNIAMYGASGGGAIETSNSESVFKNCIFSNNSAAYGGAVYSTSDDQKTEQIFINSYFVNNSASVSGGVFYNLLFTGTSPKVFVPFENATYLKNCILWQNTATADSIFKLQTYQSFGNTFINSLNISYSVIQDGYPGTGNLNTDPLFLDPANSDFRLKPNSPAVNTGDPNTADLPTTDFAGQPRGQGARVDIGAYEFANCADNICLPFSVQGIR